MSADISEASDRSSEISALIATLHATEKRLEELTGGEVDTVMGEDGRMFMLQRSQEMLRQSETLKQAAIVNALPSFIALLDREGTVLSVNEAWRRFGKVRVVQSPGCAVGVNYLELCENAQSSAAGDARRIAAGIRAVCQGEKSFALEYSIPGTEQPSWFRLVISPLGSDQPAGVVIMQVDISARKTTEMALEKLSRETQLRERMLTTTLSSLSDFTYIYNRKGQFLFANEPLLKLWGLSMEEVVGRTHLDLGYPAELAARLQSQVNQVFETGKSLTSETMYTSPSGVEGCYEYIFSPAFAADGSVDFVAGSTREITERKRSVEALRASEKRFKSLFEQAAVGVAQVDAITGGFVQVNQRYCKLTAHTQKELQQLTARDVTHPRDIARQMEMQRQVIAGDIREFTMEKRFLHQDGTEVWASLTMSAMWSPGEKPDYFMAVAQDVSDQKRMEEHFRQSQKMDAIGTLAGGIAHDFNNILAAITGYTELSRLALVDNPEVRGHLESVLQAARRATDLVRQILAFSRQQQLERKPIQLHAVLTESFKLLRATIPTTIEFENCIACDTPTVLADASQIHQILMNLGTNASHAMREKGGRLKVVLERYEVDALRAATQPRLRVGIYTRISVSDTGSGMDPATMQRIFEPFFTTKLLGEGTGLGLSVVHGIMDSHDGAITVHSQRGEGTVFHLYFPEYQGEAVMQATPENPTPRGRGECILLVDDDELLVQMGRKALAALGYEVVATTLPETALEMVRAQPQRFDLVLTDQTMPKLTGMVLAGQLLQLRPKLPIILMTGYSIALTASRVEAAGIRQLLHKPATFHALGTALHAALSERPALVRGTNPPY